MDPKTPRPSQAKPPAVAKTSKAAVIVRDRKPGSHPKPFFARERAEKGRNVGSINPNRPLASCGSTRHQTGRELSSHKSTDESQIVSGVKEFLVGAGAQKITYHFGVQRHR